MFGMKSRCFSCGAESEDGGHIRVDVTVHFGAYGGRQHQDHRSYCPLCFLEWAPSWDERLTLFVPDFVHRSGEVPHD